MSHRAVNWALEQKTVKPGPWIVLIMLADRVNKDTRRCDPDLRLLAADCNMSRATVIRHLELLENDGLIRRVRRQDPVTMKQLTTFYILGLDFDDPPVVENAESQFETRDFVDENENIEESRVSNCDSDPSLKNRDSRVSTVRLAKSLKKEPVREPYARAPARESAPPDDLDEIAEKWVEPVKAGRSYASTISRRVATRMLELNLVTLDDLRRVGVYV